VLPRRHPPECNRVSARRRVVHHCVSGRAVFAVSFGKRTDREPSLLHDSDAPRHAADEVFMLKRLARHARPGFLLLFTFAAGLSVACSDSPTESETHPSRASPSAMPPTASAIRCRRPPPIRHRGVSMEPC
jgi:hypothetical protein